MSGNLPDWFRVNGDLSFPAIKDNDDFFLYAANMGDAYGMFNGLGIGTANDVARLSDSESNALEKGIRDQGLCVDSAKVRGYTTSVLCKGMGLVVGDGKI